MSLRTTLARLPTFAHLAGVVPAAVTASATAEDESMQNNAENDAPGDPGKNDGKDARSGGKDDVDPDDDNEEDDDEEEEMKKAKAAGFSKAISAARRAGAKAERARGAAIFGSTHAEGRVPMAAQLAFGTTLSADEAIGVLKTAPAASKRGALADAMATVPVARPGNDGGDARAQSPGDRLRAAVERNTAQQTRR